ncbi:hypothetical protein MKW94_018568 [Papaver nudicaule]|uniref:Uncharacterized protein n=1 Tax=Papaver nudicaule TaxID=74823 RepID=A0AA41RLM1_PAPNU|nr:hypothetical protein [Papaver nudicaule]
MASALSMENQRAGAEIVYGPEACHNQTMEFFQELGFPKGVLPLKDLVECGRVRETGFVWMKQKTPYEHLFESTNTRKNKMRKMTGVKSKQMFMWVPITEMSIEDPAKKKIYFKTPMGIGRSFPITAFMTEEEKEKFLLESNAITREN